MSFSCSWRNSLDSRDGNPRGLLSWGNRQALCSASGKPVQEVRHFLYLTERGAAIFKLLRLVLESFSLQKRSVSTLQVSCSGPLCAATTGDSGETPARNALSDLLTVPQKELGLLSRHSSGIWRGRGGSNHLEPSFSTSSEHGSPVWCCGHPRTRVHLRPLWNILEAQRGPNSNPDKGWYSETWNFLFG